MPPKIQRELELVLMAHSTMVYGLNNDLTSRQKDNLVEAFSYECERIVLAIAETRLQSIKGIPEYDRTSRLTAYRAFCTRLMQELERSLGSRSIYMPTICQLHRQHMELLSLTHFFTQLSDDYWRQVDEKERGERPRWPKTSILSALDNPKMVEEAGKRLCELLGEDHRTLHVSADRSKARCDAPRRLGGTSENCGCRKTCGHLASLKRATHQRVR